MGSKTTDQPAYGTHRLWKSISWFAASLFLGSLGANAVLGQASTNIAINSAVLQPAVKHLGVNLGTLTNYDSGQMTKNLIVGNPGFEGQIWNSTIRCGSGSATTCTDEDIYSGWPANFWAGATYQVFFGSAAGRTGTIASSTAGGNGQGVTLNFDSSGTAPAAGDYLILRKKIPGGASGGWQTNTYGQGTVSDNLTDLPPGTLGTQTVVVTAPTASDSAGIQSSFDATNTLSFVQLNGTYQVQFKAKGLAGSSQVLVRLDRANTNYLNESVNLTNSWNTYSLTITPGETGSSVGSGVLSFSTVYGADSFELDDVSLTQVNSDPSNPTVFRDPVVNALRILQPGILRFWGNNGQLGETLDNLLTPLFGRQRAGYSAFLNQSNQVDYGLHEFMVLCQTLGAEPWIVIPTTFSTTDAANLMEYLASASTTTYGAKRAALGQTLPWTQVFSKIHLEFGNEAWNSTFTGGTILYNQPYGQQAQTVFAAMQGDPAYTSGVSGIFDFVLGGQAGSPGYNQGVQNYCSNNTSFTVAPYTMASITSFSDNESLFGSTFAEPEALMSSASTTSAEGLSPGEVYQDYSNIQQSFHPVPLSFYEVNMSTLDGTITQAALNSYASSLGAGLMVADTMLQSLKQYGVVNQNLFALPQYDFTRPDGSTVYLWGSVIDMGVTDRKRPQFLAVQLANQALTPGGSLLQTVHTGADPTWSESLMTNTVQFTGAHDLQSYAFKQGTSLSLIVFNLSRSSPLPVTFSGGAIVPSGTVQMQQLTSANLTDTNESSNVVQIASSTLQNFSAATGLTLPPYSMTVLTWSTSTGAPAISGVIASAITANSATISWSTDQAATSQVQYGTTTSYGLTSPLSSALTTIHSASLSGLTAGTTYNFAVTSANSGGTSASSANFSFTTPLPAPVISGVAVSNVTTTSATITWTTDQSSSSQVSYGTSVPYVLTTVTTALVTTHSITISGLTAGSNYNFAVTSANSAGTPASSANLTFTTLGPPIISSVAVQNITSTSATVTWTTDQASTSQVLYGATTSYNMSTVKNTTLVTSHSMTLTGLTPSSTYNFEVLSGNAFGLSNTSANFTFSTTVQGPMITYVVASTISNTSATLLWTTDVASTSQVQYGTTTAYGSLSTLNSTLTTSHSVTLTGLTLGTTYDYSVISTNGSGVSTTSGNFTFTTTGGPTTSNIAIGANILQSSVKRMGINLGTLTNFDSGQMTKNLIVQNPGFEGQVWNSIVLCVSGSANTCVDQNIYASWPAGFWNGATYQVISGAAAGRSGTVSYSTAPTGSQGTSFVLADSSTLISANSYMIVRKSLPGGSSGGWQVQTSSGGTVTDNLTDLPPGTAGQQTIVMTSPTASDYATVSNSFDTSSGVSFVQLNGTYQLQFKAKGLSGSSEIGVTLQRGGTTTFLNQNVVLGNSWNTYNLLFNPSENGSAVGPITLTLSTVFGQDSFELDDVSLTQTNGDSSNPTVFRDSVVSALRTAQPGILRYWGGNGQLGETLDNLLTPQFGRQRAGYSEYAVASNQIDYGLHEFLVLCQTIGAEPWFVVPTTFSTLDAANLIEYLAGNSATTYGAKRAALGQSTPWTQVFAKIHLEYGEQAWNPSLAGGSITDPASYGSQATGIFAAMQNDASYAASASIFDFVLGGEASVPGNITIVQNNCNNNTSFDVQPYGMNTVNSFSTNEQLFGPTFAEPEAFMSSTTGTAEGTTPGMVYQDYEAVQQSTHPVPLSFSEINLSPLGGTITQSALNTYASSLGAGLMVADTMFQGLQRFGIVNQNLYTLPGYTTTRTDGSTARLFGSVVDMGVTNLRRPQYLALQLANQALSSGATMLQTVQSGANPTWDQTLVNSVYLNGAHDLQSYAFQNGTSFSLVLFNLSRTSALPVTFNGANAPTGTVQVQQLTSANPTDTNETSNVVQIASSATTNFNDTTGLSLPPYSMTVLTWSTSTAAPVISGVTTTGITGTSAIISWSTDEPATSQVQYGTSASYGSTSTLNSALSRNHSVTLTGLTPGATYDYQALSTNSGGSPSSSPNLTFTTTLPAPVISAVTVASLTISSATITWTTDQPSTSQVSFGTTVAYGSVAENSSLVTNHSITLSGLVLNTMYDFAVTSANSAGTAASSSNSSFTAGNPPVVSNITVSNLTSNSAVVGWTTSQPSTSMVNYGTTTSYGQSTNVDSNLVTSHSVLITGLTSGVTYDFDVVSANSISAYTTSGNSTFTTVAGGAVISNVLVSGITNTSATISWTTDQPTSSLVNYGTTTAYGSSSNLISTLATAHSVTLTGLTPSATYDFDVVSANAGGVSSISPNAMFTTGTPAAVISNVLVSGITTTSATITWTTDEPATSLVNYGTTTSYGSFLAPNSTLTTSHSVTLTGLTPGTTYDFDVVSVNAVNTQTTSPNSTFATPLPAPVISSVTVTAIGTTSATVTWTTDQAASSLVHYGTTTAYGSSSTLNTTLVTSHSVTLTGLTANTLYDFDVVSANSAGTSSTSPNAAFTTAANAPVISNVAVTGITGISATVTWTTDQATSSLVNYGTTTAYGSSSTLNTALVTSHSVTITGLSAGTLYDFDVVSANSAGTPSTSPNSTFTTVNATPVISNVAVSSIGSTSATVTWTTDQATSSLVHYGTTTAYGSSSTLNSTLVTSHSVALTGLSISTLYDFDVVSTNSVGTPATSANFTFTTTAAKPLISNVAVTSITATSATITWTTDQSSSSLVNYGVTTSYGSASALGTALVTSHSVTITGLTAATTYNFDVVSANSAGTSSTSANATFATTATPPNVGYLVAWGINNSSAVVTWSTDVPATTQLAYGTTTALGQLSPLQTSLTASHGVTLSGLTAGTTYYYVAQSTGANGATGYSATVSFTTTGTAPPAPPTISSVTSTGITFTSATITWTTSQPATSQVNYGTTTSYGSSSPLNSTLQTSQSVTLTGLSPNTTYNFDVVSANAGALSSTSSNFTFTTLGVTGTPPVISNVAAAVNSAVSVTITWTTDQPSSAQVNYGTTTAYGSASALNSTLQTSQSVTLTGLTPGTTYDFDVVSAVSGGASTTSTNATFTTPPAPVAPVISSVAVTSIGSTSVIVTWTTDQASSSLVNYGKTIAYGSSSTFSSALVTSHSVTLTGLTAVTTYLFDVVSANASAISSTSGNYTFTTAATGAPVISAITVSSITNNSAVVSWTTDQGSSSLVNYGATTAYGLSSPLNAALTTSHTITLSGLAAGTTYNFDVVSANSGAISATSPNYTFLTTGTVGNPVVSNVSVTNITSTSAIVTWTTDQATSTQVNYGTTTSYGSSSTLDKTLVTSHSVTLSGLAASTTYDFDVMSANSAGTVATSANSVFTTPATTATPPNVGYLAAWGINNSSATVTWSTDVAATTQLAYGTTTALGQLSPLQTTLAASHGVTLNGLLSGTTYYYVAQSTAANGATGYSPTSTFTTTGTAPAPPPVISNVASSNVSGTSATITWTTSVAATAQVNYGTTTAYGSSSAVTTALVTSQSVTLTGLTPGTTYNFDVVSANSGGNSSVSANFTLTTSTASGTPPVISSIATSGITTTSVTITWTTDQASSSQVNYGTTAAYGSSSTLNSSLATSHSVTLTGLTASTTYNFSVVSAVSGGATASSPNSTFTTASASATPPFVGYVAAWGINNNGATITWSTDVVANTQVAYGTTTALGQLSPLQTALAASHGVTLTGLASGTTYYFVAQSTGANGATGYSNTLTFTTTGTPSAPAPVISNVTATAITSTSVTITWTTDQASTAQVNYGATTAYGSSSPVISTLQTSQSVTLTGLTPSTLYNFQVVSANSAGTVATSADYTFTTASPVPAPVITAVAAGSLTNTTATITWTTDEPSSSQVNYGPTTAYGSSSTLNSALVTSHSVTLTGLIAGTTYNFDVISANSGGSQSTSTNSTFTTTGTAGTPVISSVASTAISTTSATITWTTDQATSSLVNYGTTTSYGSASSLDNTLKTNHSVTLTGLTAGTTYNFDVVSANSAGTQAISANNTFSTTPAGPAPNLSYVVSWGIGNTGATVTWTSDLASTTQLAYGTTTALGQLSPLQTALVTSHGVTLAGLTPGTKYYFVAQSTGSNGVTGYSTTYNFTTTGSLPPTISAINVVPATGNKATISWTTSTPTTSYVQYGAAAGSYGRYSAVTALTTSPVCTLPYVPSGTVHYQLVSTDASGNQTLSADMTFTEP